MKPPFRLILSLLGTSLFILITSLSFYLLIPESPPPGCGVKSSDQLICGNALQRMVLFESMDSTATLKFLKGEALFKDAGCNTCHEVNLKKVGPPLQNISSRRDSIWIRKAIVNFQKLVKEKDKEAVQVYKEYNEIQMPHHEFLSIEEVEMIIFYLDKGVYRSY